MEATVKANLKRHVTLAQLIVAMVLVLGGGAGMFALITFEPNVQSVVVGDGNQGDISVARSPGDVTAATIACSDESTVEKVTRETSVLGYKARVTYWDEQGLSTFYSLVLTLDSDGQPLDQFSVAVEQDTTDTAQDDLDGLRDGKYVHTEFVPVDGKALECLVGAS